MNSVQRNAIGFAYLFHVIRNKHNFLVSSVIIMLCPIGLSLPYEPLLCVPNYSPLTLRQRVLLNSFPYWNYFNDTARAEKLTGVLMKILICWNITPYLWVITECTVSRTALFHRISLFQHSEYRFFSIYQLNAHFLYSITIYMLHYNPQHVSSSTLLIFRRTNCIITASGIFTLCKQPAYCTAVYRE